MGRRRTGVASVTNNQIGLALVIGIIIVVLAIVELMK